MKRIKLRDYRSSMGTFIDVNYNNSNIVNNLVHIPYDKLMNDYRELLDKNSKYFIYCNGGIKSKNAVNILEFYGYDVTYVEKN